MWDVVPTLCQPIGALDLLRLAGGACTAVGAGGGAGFGAAAGGAGGAACGRLSAVVGDAVGSVDVVFLPCDGTALGCCAAIGDAKLVCLGGVSEGDFAGVRGGVGFGGVVVARALRCDAAEAVQWIAVAC